MSQKATKGERNLIQEFQEGNREEIWISIKRKEETRSAKKNKRNKGKEGRKTQEKKKEKIEKNKGKNLRERQEKERRT